MAPPSAGATGCVELLRRGSGELRLVRAAFSFALDRRPSDVRLGAPSSRAAALMDVGCYCVSAARLLAGEPEAVTGEQVRRRGGRRFTATLRFDGDVLAHFDCGVDTPDRAELEVVGSDGALLLRDPFHSREPVIEVRAADGSVERVEVERETRTPASCATSPPPRRGEREPRLGARRRGRPGAGDRRFVRERGQRRARWALVPICSLTGPSGHRLSERAWGSRALKLPSRRRGSPRWRVATTRT